MEQSPERKREGAETLGGHREQPEGLYRPREGAQRPGLHRQAAAAEAELKRRSAGNAAIGDPWADVAKAMAAYRDFYVADRFSLPSGDLFGYAQTLVRAAAERGKPNGERLPGYSAIARCRWSRSACSTAADLPVARPADRWNGRCRRRANISAPTIPRPKLLLGKESPEALAARLVAGTKLADPAVRKALWDGGRRAIDASKDPMIVYARRIDANDRAAAEAGRRRRYTRR